MNNEFFSDLRNAIVTQHKKGEDIDDTIKQLDKTIKNWEAHHDITKITHDLVHLVYEYYCSDMPYLDQFARLVYSKINTGDLDLFDNLLKVADSLMESGESNKEEAKKFYQAAEHRVFQYQGPNAHLNKNLKNTTSLGDSLCQTYQDKQWAREVYKTGYGKFIGTFEEVYGLASSIALILEDIDFAREVYLVAFERLKESKKTEAKHFGKLAEGIGVTANDKESAHKIVRYYLDNHAREFSDFIRLVNTVTDSDCITNLDLAGEVIASCWSLAKTYDDFLRILDFFNINDKFYSGLVKTLATAVVSRIENKEQKDEFCENLSGYNNADLNQLIADIKNLSIEQLHEKYPPYDLRQKSDGAGNSAEKQKAYRDDDDELSFDDLDDEGEEVSWDEIFKKPGSDDDDELSLDAPDDDAKQKAIAAIKEDFNEFENLKDFHGDKDVVMVAIKEYGGNLEYATEKLRDDKEVVMAAVAQSGFALEHATERLRGDKAVVMAAVAEEGLALEHATEKLRGDKEVVMAAVAQSGLALEYATEKLRGDKEVVMAAVAEEGSALEHATEKLRGDKEVVMKSLTGGTLFASMAFEYATEKLRDDKEVVTAGIAEAGHNLQFASQRWQDDDVIVMAAIQQCGTALEFASQRLKDNDAVVMAAVEQDGLALEFASQRLKDISGVVHAAMAQDTNALQYANSRYWSSRELVLRYVANVLDNYGVESLSELDSDDFESEFGFMEADFVRDVWDNRNNLATCTSSGSEKPQALKCPSCGKRHIYFYQGVPARDTYYAYEVDPANGRPGDDVEICPRMDRVDEVIAETFYLCHDCMSSWRTWDECKRACLPNAEDKPAVNKEVTEKKVTPATNIAPANSDDFRVEYSQKIASGALDPAEVSYSSFLATKAKPKELNYRELYSRMISEGKIDPTETTFDEVQTVAKLFLGKDESEFKATYAQGIGSGEIDPVSTTYDEIVRVAKFLNEATKVIAVPPPTTEELKKLYAADIGAGKIDPVEVSFEKFMASYGK